MRSIPCKMKGKRKVKLTPYWIIEIVYTSNMRTGSHVVSGPCFRQNMIQIDKPFTEKVCPDANFVVMVAQRVVIATTAGATN